jgi:O-antigen/teichoic acid export membrane protein
LGTVYGEEFSRFGPLAALSALQYGVAVLVFGQGIALKATGQMRLLWRGRAIVAVASVVSMVILVHFLGTIGAGWAGAATGAYFALCVYVVHRTEFRRRTAERADGERVIARAAALPTVPPPAESGMP